VWVFILKEVSEVLATKKLCNIKVPEVCISNTQSIGEKEYIKGVPGWNSRTGG
jgi:hypothetical protein